MLHLVGCFHYCINDARSHKHQTKILVLFFKRKVETLTDCQSYGEDLKMITKTVATSYRVSYRIAGAGQVHTVAEPQIKRCAAEMVTSVLGGQSTEKPETVNLSNNTV